MELLARRARFAGTVGKNGRQNLSEKQEEEVRGTKLVLSEAKERSEGANGVKCNA